MNLIMSDVEETIMIVDTPEEAMNGETTVRVSLLIAILHLVSTIGAIRR